VYVVYYVLRTTYT